MLLNFTDTGLLSPTEVVEVSIQEVYDTFVQALPASRTRVYLFREWTKYNQLLRREIGQDFVQWVDGSFVTQKLNPKDIDIVSFIPYQLYERHFDILDNLWADKWEQEGIDAYFVKVYPGNHPDFENTERDKEQWTKRYSFTKPDATFVRRLKGFLTIQIR